MAKTTEEQREYAKRYYQANREKVLEKQRAKYKAKKKKERAAAYKRKYNAEHADELREKRQARWKARNTEEFRAERRRKYAEKHKDDPMTEHRRVCIEAQQKRMTMTLEERKAREIAKRAEKAAKADMRVEPISPEEEGIRKIETVIKFIREWANRKILGSTINKSENFGLVEADVVAYHREAIKYFEMDEKLKNTPPTDYSTRNILGYKMRCIEDRFNRLLDKKYATKKQLQNK